MAVNEPMANNPSGAGGDERELRLDAIINECLDLEAGGDLREARRLAKEGAAVDPSFDQRLARTRDAVSRLSLLPHAPDVTWSVLDQVDSSRPFLAGRSRGRVARARLAMACTGLALLASVAIVNRYAPEMLTFSPRPAPVSRLVDASSADLDDSLRSLSDAVQTMQSDLAAPMRGLAAAGAPDEGERRFAFEVRGPVPAWPVPRGSPIFSPESGLDTRLALGSTSAYDKPHNADTSLAAVPSSAGGQPSARDFLAADRLAILLPRPSAGGLAIDTRLILVGSVRRVPLTGLLPATPASASAVRADAPPSDEEKPSKR